MTIARSGWPELPFVSVIAYFVPYEAVKRRIHVVAGMDALVSYRSGDALQATIRNASLPTREVYM